MDDIHAQEADSLIQEMKELLKNKPQVRRHPLPRTRSSGNALALVNALRNDLRSLGGLGSILLEKTDAPRKKKKPKRKTLIADSPGEGIPLAETGLSELIGKKLESEPLIKPPKAVAKPRKSAVESLKKRRTHKRVTGKKTKPKSAKKKTRPNIAKKKTIALKRQAKKPGKKPKKAIAKVPRMKPKTSKKTQARKNKLSGREKLLMLLAKKRRR